MLGFALIKEKNYFQSYDKEISRNLSRFFVNLFHTVPGFSLRFVSIFKIRCQIQIFLQRTSRK